MKNDFKMDKYPERPFEAAQADPKELVKIEDRQPDQIADYHEKFPTLRAKDLKSEDIPSADPTDSAKADEPAAKTDKK